mmetsp:Transcript_47582/g.110195  ORF Transcript_47582/g.110195 Transcript_47582/m.110195 type:complete len:266 (-) Transcript_47582:814-1611(-)
MPPIVVERWQGGHKLAYHWLFTAVKDAHALRANRELNEFDTGLSQPIPHHKAHILCRLRWPAHGDVPQLAVNKADPRASERCQRFRHTAEGASTAVCQPHGVVKGHMLLLGAREAVVVLVNAEGLRKRLLPSNVWRVRSEHQRRELPDNLEESAGLADVAFESGPRGEVASPDLVCSISIGEEVVRLEGPRDSVLSGLGFHVLLRCGVDGLHAAVRVDILDDAVEVLIPQTSVLPLEVGAHGEHDVVAPGAVGLPQCSCDEVVDS